MTPAQVPELRTVILDLPALAARFGRRLRTAGLPVGAEREATFADALTLTRPLSRPRLYHTARAVFLTDREHLRAFDRVFTEVFGGASWFDEAIIDTQPEHLADPDTPVDSPPPPRPPSAETGRGAPLAGMATSPRGRLDAPGKDLPVPVLASDQEVLRTRRFDQLGTDELAALHRLMSRMRIEPPLRRTRRSHRHRHGDRVDLRRTLRSSLRTGGEPIRLARRRRRERPRRLVVLCDISGSMEPYTRAYLQFLACAAGAGRHAEVFLFATRLTRVTRAMRAHNPERAIQGAAGAAPDWSSGTRIGDALKTFNDRHGRRGMARGAVVVILSDGWERGDPQLVAQEMARLRRLAHRIVWVNPRAGAPGFAPRAGGLVAALPHCDALVSGHSLDALGSLVDAIAAQQFDDLGLSVPDVPESEPESWASATPVPGSSVAMPSGYSPSRGRTTPGW